MYAAQCPTSPIYVTQCPTKPQQSLDYTFYAVPSGTYWYHDHVAYQRADGAFGPLVVRDRPSGPTRRYLSADFKKALDLNDICDPSDNTIFVITFSHQIVILQYICEGTKETRLSYTNIILKYT